MNDADQEYEKQSLSDLAKGLSRLPAGKRRAAIEASASIAGVSLKASRAFVAAAADAAKILSAEDLRAWADLGRRLAMGKAETGMKFFADGAESLKPVPSPLRHLVFEIAAKQLVLSSSVASESFGLVPELAKSVNDNALLARFLELGLQVAMRSAKHSSILLKASPEVAECFRAFGEERESVIDASFKLAENFATRTGGMTADLWVELPQALTNLSARDAVLLLSEADRFLEFGGSVTLLLISSGSDAIAAGRDIFVEWTKASRTVAAHGNAVLIAFLRATPVFLRRIRHHKSVNSLSISHVLRLIAKIAETDAESALSALRASAGALEKVSVKQYEAWVIEGLAEHQNSTSKARRSYFALETRESRDKLQQAKTGISLEAVQNVLRIYVEGLTGREVEVAPLSAVPQESRIGDGKTIFLPATVAEFNDDERDFKLYKVLAAHAAGQIEFGTYARATDGLKAVYSELSALYSATAEERDAFSLAGYIEDVQKGERARPDDVFDSIEHKLPAGGDYRSVLSVFPEPRLARRIFGTMENARIDACLRAEYRGLRKDLDLMQQFLRQNRPYIFDVPANQVAFELLFQITMCGGATDDARQFYPQVVDEISAVLERFVRQRSEAKVSTVADSLLATSRVYDLFQNVMPERAEETDSREDEDETGEFAYEDKSAQESVTEDKVKREREMAAEDVSELFNAWNSLDDEGEPDDLRGAEAWAGAEIPEQALESGDIAFAYDEWDRELNDYRVGWSRVIEKKVKEGDRTFVELTRTRYRGVISSIRHQFQLMKPENLTRINRQIDGEDYDLNALVDFVIDRKADGRQSENIYTKRLRRERDVAVSILLDQSSSTARTITRNPLQPYTHPGRRIIEIEKEGLVLMSEALDAVGDIYSINGFTSEGRRNVKFYVVKDFADKYDAEVEKRIGGINFENNTRLGAAIRHAANKLLRQDSRTKLLIVLTDGRPYDHDYGDARYAREDVREALTEAKMSGITPFCITVDRESEAELRDLYGDVGYTIIDDVLSLPERMPNIYRRLTT
ncbi:MAG TPA: VWA domain-containing protein [Pyrinomonadaceae bacterium]|nr:VWA domain-containing protein [Pyrinomonadaceae bacterium]